MSSSRRAAVLVRSGAVYENYEAVKICDNRKAATLFLKELFDNDGEKAVDEASLRLKIDHSFRSGGPLEIDSKYFVAKVVCDGANDGVFVRLILSVTKNEATVGVRPFVSGFQGLTNAQLVEAFKIKPEEIACVQVVADVPAVGGALAAGFKKGDILLEKPENPKSKASKLHLVYLRNGQDFPLRPASGFVLRYVALQQTPAPVTEIARSIPPSPSEFSATSVASDLAVGRAVPWIPLLSHRLFQSPSENSAASVATDQAVCRALPWTLAGKGTSFQAAKTSVAKALAGEKTLAPKSSPKTPDPKTPIHKTPRFSVSSAGSFKFASICAASSPSFEHFLNTQVGTSPESAFASPAATTGLSPFVVEAERPGDTPRPSDSPGNNSTVAFGTSGLGQAGLSHVATAGFFPGSFGSEPFGASKIPATAIGGSVQTPFAASFEALSLIDPTGSSHAAVGHSFGAAPAVGAAQAATGSQFGSPQDTVFSVDQAGGPRDFGGTNLSPFTLGTPT